MAAPHRQLSLLNPGAREAYLVSWVSVAAALAAVVLGLATSRVSGSPAMFGFALENVVEALSSAICVWRWWGGGSLLLLEDELVGRERRAGAAIAIAFVVLGIGVALNAVQHLAAGEEVDYRELLSAVSAPSAFVFLLLGAVKLHIGTRSANSQLCQDEFTCSAPCVDAGRAFLTPTTRLRAPRPRVRCGRMESGSLRKDGLCSLSGGLLSLGVWASAEASDAWWWLDALVAVAVAAALVWYGREELRRLDGQWQRLEFWRDGDGKAVAIDGVQEMDRWTQQADDPDEML